MNTENNKETIERYLLELANDYKQLLYKALLEKSNTFDELSITELLKIDSDIKKPLRSNYNHEQIRRKKYIFAGTIYFFIGVITLVISFVLQYMEHNISTFDIVTLVAILSCVSGVITVVFSFAIPYIPFRSQASKRNIGNKMLEYEVVVKWRDFEGLVNDINTEEKPYNSYSVIQFLNESKLIDEQEQQILKNFLRLRNEIVHSTNTTHENADITELLSQVDIIINRLKILL